MQAEQVNFEGRGDGGVALHGVDAVVELLGEVVNCDGVIVSHFMGNF